MLLDTPITGSHRAELNYLALCIGGGKGGCSVLAPDSNRLGLESERSRIIKRTLRPDISCKRLETDKLCAVQWQLLDSFNSEHY